MHLTISNKQIISFIVWLFVILSSTVFFGKTQHFEASLLLYIYNLFVSVLGILYTIKNKNIFLFNPIFHAIYCSIFYYTFMGLFCLSSFNKIELFLDALTISEDLKTTISTIFICCFFIMLLPTILTTFSRKKIKLNLNFLMRNYNYKKITKYLYYSFPVLIILYLLLCLASGFSPIDAILNPAEFRNASSRDLANVVYIFYQPLFVFNLCLTIQLALLKKFNSRNFNIYLKFFILYCIFWGLVSGGRGWFVTYIIYFSIFYTFKNKIKVNFKLISKTIIIIVLLFLFIGIYGTYRNYRTQLSKGTNIVSSNKLNIIEKTLFRMDTYATSLQFFEYMYFEYNGLNNYHTENFKNMWKSQMTLLLPRRLFPDKLEPMHGELTKQIHPFVYFSGVCLIYGGIASIFYEGGFVWLFFNFLLLGIILMLLQKNLKRYYNYDFFQLFYVYFFIDTIIQLFSLGILNEPQTWRLFVRIIIYTIILIFISSKSKSIKVFN